MATVKFPSEMPTPTTIKGTDKVLMSNGDNGESMAPQFDQLKQYLSITGIDLNPADYPPGSALPTGPLGENRRITNVLPGSYTWNGNTYTVPEGSTGTLFWSGSEWSLTTQELPQAENKIKNWEAIAYQSVSQVVHFGQLYQSTGPTLSTDVPGESNLWVPVLEIPEVQSDLSVNLFDPTSLLTGKILLCNGTIVNDTFDATTGIIRGLKGNTDYYIQGRSVRTTFRYFDKYMNPLPFSYGVDACAGPVNGVYRTPNIDEVVAVFVTRFSGAGGSANDVMFFEGTEPLPEFIPYRRISSGINGAVIGASDILDDDNTFKAPTEFFDGKFTLEGGSDNVFDKSTMINEGYSLSSSGAWIASATSSMSKPILVDKTKTHILITGRSRAPLVFRTDAGVNIPSSYGSDYNAGPVNGVYPIPENAHDFVFAIKFNGSGSAETTMVIYGENENIPTPPAYIPYESPSVTGVKIGGAVYPFAADGGGSDPSSFKFQGVRFLNNELTIISKYSFDNNLKTIFKTTGNNSTFLPNNAALISRENDRISEADFDKEITVEYSLLRWMGTDGIGPYTLRDKANSGFVGGNHGAPEPANPEPPYYDYATSKTISHEIWADGIKISDGDIVDAKVVKIRVVNEIYDIDGFYVDPVQYTVDFNEIITVTVVDGQMMLEVEQKAVRPIAFQTIYSLQMQLSTYLGKIYFPQSQYNGVEDKSVNPATGERSYGNKIDFPKFHKFIVMTSDHQNCNSIWIDNSKGLGIKDRLTTTGPIARGKAFKLYHNLLNTATSLAAGASLYYVGGSNIFKNKADGAQGLFSYYQYEKGLEEWEFDKFLICDFAGDVTGRNITINYPELIGKTLEVVDVDPTITLPTSLVVTSSGVVITNTGHGVVKFRVNK